MTILLTGANGYIGKRLLLALGQSDHQIICCVRDKLRFEVPASISQKVEVIQVDFLVNDRLDLDHERIDVAYYLMHSMSTSDDYDKLERIVANNFIKATEPYHLRQVIYLSGISNSNELSKHLTSRKSVELELSKGQYALTVLRAGIIIGSGSASFEIIRDLVEKLPIMVTPKWLHTKSQPIAVRDVINFLTGVFNNENTFNSTYDICGPDVLKYKEMLLTYASVRGLKRWIWVIPVMTPRLSSYWLYFVTSTSYKLAVALVNSMKVEVVGTNNNLATDLGIQPISYRRAIEMAFQKIESNQVISSWKDSFISGRFDDTISEHLTVPSYGCFLDSRSKKVKDVDSSINRIWKIGGETGWYYGNLLWRIRGFLDKLVGGVGLRRGRTSPTRLASGDAVDFWRVLYANKEEGRLLLFAEMKLPGEAWLEFRIKGNMLTQIATFRPKGVAGRLYWYSLLPFHGFIFNGMLNKISE